MTVFVCPVCDRSFEADAPTAICTGVGTVEKRKDKKLVEYKVDHKAAVMDVVEEVS